VALFATDPIPGGCGSGEASSDMRQFGSRGRTRGFKPSFYWGFSRCIQWTLTLFKPLLSRAGRCLPLFLLAIFLTLSWPVLTIMASSP
jgi:hypothetical protein